MIHMIHMIHMMASDGGFVFSNWLETLGLE